MLAVYTNGNGLTIKNAAPQKIVNTMKYIHIIQFKGEDYELLLLERKRKIK